MVYTYSGGIQKEKRSKLTYILIALFLAVAMAAFTTIQSVRADSSNIDFETYATGTINAQNGWSSLGAAGAGCALYDHNVVTNVGAPVSFGTQSLRISNAITSGCFGDQTFSKSLVDEAGETVAQGGVLSGGTRQPYFEAQWDFASTVPGAEQPGLSVVASPDRGDGARMSWVQMTDTTTGISVNFFDYQTGLGFVQTNIASELDRSVPHTIKITMQFVDGLNNDVVKVYVDGVLAHTGTSWEGYFVESEGNPTRTVDSVLFRTGGAAAPATAGQGFLIDNLKLFSGQLPLTNKDQCKKDGWQAYGFKNQGLCIQFVNTGKDSRL